MTKELLRERLASVSAALGNIPGTHLHDIRDFVNGTMSISKQGLLKLPLALPAETLLADPKDLRSVMSGDWKMLPLVLFIDAEPPEPSEEGTARVAQKADPLEGYELVLLVTEDEYTREGERMHNALKVFHKHFADKGTQVYSLRYKGHSLLSLAVPVNKCVNHVVGPSNRPPTPHELELLEPFLTAKGFTLQYDPNSMH